MTLAMPLTSIEEPRQKRWTVTAARRSLRPVQFGGKMKRINRSAWINVDGMIGEDKMLARRFPIRTVAIAVGVSLIFAALVAEYVICHAVPVRSFNTQAWLKSESPNEIQMDQKI